MAPLPEHLDPEKLFAGGEEEAPPEEKEEKPAKADPKPEPEDEDDDDSAMSLEELEEHLDARAKERDKAKAKEKEQPDELEDLLMDDRDRELAKIRKERDELLAEREARAEQEKYTKASREMNLAVNKLKLTNEERDKTIRYFDINLDMVGVRSFEEAALRVNPDVRGRLASPDDPAFDGNGPKPSGNAKVITRGSSEGSPPPAPKLKAARGVYSDVSKHVLSSGRGTNYFAREGR